MDNEKIEKQNKLVNDISELFTAYFVKLGYLPEDENIIKDIQVESELRRILAISDRLSFLAKGLITRHVRNQARDTIQDIVTLALKVDHTMVSQETKDRVIRNMVDSETDVVVNKLGLVADKDHCQPADPVSELFRRHNNNIKRKDITPEAIDASDGPVSYPSKPDMGDPVVSSRRLCETIIDPEEEQKAIVNETLSIIGEDI
jgi:hypothetical protein